MRAYAEYRDDRPTTLSHRALVFGRNGLPIAGWCEDTWSQQRCWWPAGAARL
jgi:hypothetical protein